MKEIIIAIITTFFPMEIPSDQQGYCSHEIVYAEKNGHTYKITHKNQGTYYASKEAYEFFIGKSGSLFRWSEGHKPHVTRIKKWRYSWGNYITVSPEEEKYDKGCWK